MLDNGSPVVAFVKENEVAVFMALALFFSWVFWIPLEFGGIDSDALRFCLNNIGVLGPLFAAFEMILIVQGAGGIKSLAGGMLKWRTGIEWYVVALALPLFIEALVLFGTVLSGPSLTFSKSLLGDNLTLLGQVYFAIVTATALFGYLLPRLLKSFSPMVSSLLMAAFFIVWHLPFVLVNINGGRADYELWWALGNVGVFFLFTWLYRGVKGSLVPLILFNLGLNYFRWLAKGVMQATPIHDLYGLDFSLHLAVGLIVLLACRKYFLGKAPVAIGAPGALSSD